MIWLIAALLIFAIESAEATQRYMSEDGATSGTCTTTGTACRFDRVVAVAACGDTITILNGDGVYSGANNMLNFNAHAPAAPNCTLGNEITMSAETDGGVFFDGQFARTSLWAENISYWIFSGFDLGNSDNLGGGSVVLYINNASHLTFQRMCVSNLKYVSTSNAEDAVQIVNSSSNLFEDFCVFGAANNLLLEFNPSTTSNTFRRIWTRWEGEGQTPSLHTDCGGPNFQIGYAAHQTSLYENVISVFDPEQIQSGDPCFGLSSVNLYGSLLVRDSPYSGDHGYTFRGYIAYGYNSPNILINSPGSGAWFNQAGGGDSHGGAFAIDIQDMFIDGLSQTSANVGPIGLTCVSGSCSGQLVNRVTSLRGTQSSSITNSGQYGLYTNFNECTSLGACPNFYTGGSPGTGARNCFRYQDGTLTSTPLWPWPMDDRIKAALARAHAAGTGGSALAGTAGSGYAAATVTSEIVSRYGSVPTACLSGSSFTPSFPVASDFPSVSVRDDFNRADSGTLGAGWTELLGSVFSIASNRAVAPAGGARAIYSDTKMQVDHEVYGTWTTVPSNSGGYSTFLSFAGTDLTVNNQYRLRVNFTLGSNTLIDVRRIDGVGTDTEIMAGVDLGIEAVDGNSFGIRVSGTTISVYWKWTDGIWYRVGQFTDSNLSSLPSTGVYGGIAGGSPAVIDNYGAGPFVDQPVQEPPSPPASVGAGRFGTTFPGVR